MTGPLVTVKLPFKPFNHQRAAHALRLAIRFLVLVWHRRGGKTVFAVVELIMAALVCTRPRGRFGYIAPLLKQAKGVAWDYLKAFTRDIPGVSYNESELSVLLPNGATVRLFGADNPDSLRGIYLDGVVLDEVADMKPNVWGEIIRPLLADREGWAIFIGTPKGLNLFSKLYYEARDGREGWAADLKRASDTEIISEAEIEDARMTMSPQQFAQEFECDFAASGENKLIQLEHVLAAQQRILQSTEYSFAAKVLGVDVARYGDDHSVLFPRQGLCAFRPVALQGLETMELAGRVAQAIDKWMPDAVFVDGGGIGAGVVDRLRQLGYPVIEGDFGSKASDPRFENKRAEIWWEMAEWVKSGALPKDDSKGRDFAAELATPKYTYKNKRGRMQLESKDDMRKRGEPSPDVADALALTFYAPVARRGFGIGPKSDTTVADTHYDPFERSA